MLDWSLTHTDSFTELCSNTFEPCVCLCKYLNHCFNLVIMIQSIFLFFLTLSCIIRFHNDNNHGLPCG